MRIGLASNQNEVGENIHCTSKEYNVDNGRGCNVCKRV